MAFNEVLAERVRELFDDRDDVREQPMFGGLTFMVRENFCCGVQDDDLIVRLGAEAGEAALEEPYARPMDFTGRPMRGWLYVGPAADFDDGLLSEWVRRSLDHCLSLPPKKPKAAKGSKAAR
jgi:TfoX/Sxy family transcriptional regulator of competence genes